MIGYDDWKTATPWVEENRLSECCDAEPAGDIDEEIGVCSDCKTRAFFYNPADCYEKDKDDDCVD